MQFDSVWMCSNLQVFSKVQMVHAVEGDYINWTWIKKNGMKLSILEDRIFRLCVAISCWILTSLFCGFSLLSFMWSASHIEQLDYLRVHSAIWIVRCKLDCCLEQRRWLYIAFWGKGTSSFLWMQPSLLPSSLSLPFWSSMHPVSSRLSSNDCVSVPLSPSSVTQQYQLR